MRKRPFTVARNIAVLRQAESGVAVTEIFREEELRVHRISCELELSLGSSRGGRSSVKSLKGSALPRPGNPPRC